MWQKIGQTDIKASKIALGCMRMASLEAKNVDDVITKCLDLGIDFLIMRIFMVRGNQNRSLEIV